MAIISLWLNVSALCIIQGSISQIDNRHILGNGEIDALVNLWVLSVIKEGFNQIQGMGG